MKLLFFILVAYFIGAIPNGIIIGKKFKGIDLREHGSGNSGATNAYRVLGPKFGISVLILDMLKGIFPMFFAHKLGVTGTPLVLMGLLSVIGHSISPFLGFKGGKGVATSLGMFLYLIPKVVLLLILIFIVTVFISRYVALGSIVSAVCLPILVLMIPPANTLEINLFFLEIICIFIAVFVVYRHKDNITRLVDGTEAKFTIKSKE